jgi:hypothetical protein
MVWSGIIIIQDDKNNTFNVHDGKYRQYNIHGLFVNYRSVEDGMHESKWESCGYGLLLECEQ